MNPVAIAKFFHIIYDIIFMSLFSIGETIRGLFEPILNYFVTIKTNGHEMLYLHRLV